LEVESWERAGSISSPSTSEIGSSGHGTKKWIGYGEDGRVPPLHIISNYRIHQVVQSGRRLGLEAIEAVLGHVLVILIYLAGSAGLSQVQNALHDFQPSFPPRILN
jgi:hypothetical protein